MQFLDRNAQASDLQAALDRAQETQKDARVTRKEAAQTRWRSRKVQLRARRLRRTTAAARPPALEDFVEVGSVDDLVDVLVLLAGRGEGGTERSERRRRS